MRRVITWASATLLLIALISAVLLGAIWITTERAAQDAVTAWAERVRDMGYQVAIGEVTVSGSPLAPKVEVAGITLGQPNSAIPWEWRADTVRRYGRGSNATFRIGGIQTLSYTVAGETHTLRAGARRFRFSSTGSETKKPSFFIEIIDMFIDRPSELGRMTLGRLRMRVDPGEGPGTIPDGTLLEISIDKLVLPEHRRGPLGDTIASLSTRIDFEGSITELNIPGSLATWRDSDGRIRIRNTRASWGTLELEGRSGALWLDQKFRPTGGMMAAITGYDVTIDAFQAAGMLNEDEMVDIRAAMSFLRQRRAAGTSIGLPVEIKDGVVFVGQATLGTVPKLVPIVGD